jgi:hypothetical protein
MLVKVTHSCLPLVLLNVNLTFVALQKIRFKKVCNKYYIISVRFVFSQNVAQPAVCATDLRVSEIQMYTLF